MSRFGKAGHPANKGGACGLSFMFAVLFENHSIRAKIEFVCAADESDQYPTVLSADLLYAGLHGQGFTIELYCAAVCNGQQQICC